MPMLAQHVLVIMLVAGACAFVGWQGCKTMSLRKGKLGACCSKGCDAGEASPEKTTEAKTQFIPLESLTSRRHS